MISFGLDEDLSAIQSAVRDFAGEALRPKLRLFEKEGVPAKLREQHRELGLFGVAWPAEAGGQGLSRVARVTVEEELAFGDVGAAVALDATGVGGNVLAAFAPARLKAYGDDAHKLLAFGVAEPGPHKPELDTRAEARGGKWVLAGRKAPVLFGAEAHELLVLAQEAAGAGEKGYGLFLVKKGGFRAGPRQVTLGLEACPACEVTIEGEGERIAGGEEMYAKLAQAFDEVALVNAARAVGASRAAYEYAVGYAGERTAFGKPIGHFQAIAFLLSDMATQVDAAKALVLRAAWSLDSGKDDARAAVMGALAQAQECAYFCTNNAVQVLGGAGYVKDHPVEKWMRDAKTLAVHGYPAACAHAFLGADALGQTPALADALPLPEIAAALS